MAAARRAGGLAMTAFGVAVALAEGGWLPDPVIRWGIRRACARRLRDEARRRGGLTDAAANEAIVAALARAPVAPLPAAANAQHYEVPAAFFALVLGPHRKYSCCWWGDGVRTLAAAEAASLDLTIARADIADGMRILELGCGWGSLSLELARRFPRSRILGVSNSASQRRFIVDEARRRGLANLTIETADVNGYAAPGRFDRVVSVEMFEHLRNYPAMLARIAGWLERDGQLFVHVFCHRRFTYPFQTAGDDDWMGRHFFTGGLMPAADLLPAVPGPLVACRQWRWGGEHYERTARAWLANLDARRDDALIVLAGLHGAAEAPRALARWRLFFLACAELFATGGGTEWGVAHYRFAHRGSLDALEG
jgi:cyclopropane-fatty-acyl-phospholipid synthase